VQGSAQRANLHVIFDARSFSRAHTTSKRLRPRGSASIRDLIVEAFKVQK